MKELRIRDPFPSMPDSFDARIERALREMEAADMKRHHKITLSLAAALALILALGAVAFAATKAGILDFLFYDAKPTERAEELVVAVGQTVEQDGVKLTLDSYVNNGYEVALAWTVESSREEPVFYRFEEPVIEGNTAEKWHGSGLESAFMLGGDVEGQPVKKRFNAFTRVPLSDGVQNGETTVSLRARLYTPGREIAQTEGSGPEPKPWDKLFVIGGGDVVEVMPSLSYDVRDAEGMSLGEMTMDKFIQQGYLNPLTELALTAQIDLSQQPANHSRPQGQTQFEFPDYTLTVKTLDFSNVVVDTALVLELKRDLIEPEDPLSERYYRLLDGQGNRLELTAFSSGTSISESDDAPSQIEFRRRYSGIDAVPDEVILMPVAYFDVEYTDDAEAYDALERAEEPNHYIRDEAVTLKIGR